MTFDGPLLQDRWRLGRRLGRGAQAQTYLAQDEADDGKRVVVVKQLRLNSGDSTWKKFDLFEREVRVLKALDHPGIPNYLDTFESEPGVFNLVMEKAPGATLRAYTEKYRFTDGMLRDVLVGVLEILRYLHGLRPPVIHRDIKPANLLRDADGAISLVDFGGVRDVLREGGGSTMVGTFGYMAPEQLHGQATPATDIYSLGATIAALAGGIEPEQIPRKGLRMDLKAHLAGSDRELVAVLAAMTEPDPDRRPQTAEAVLQRLEASKGTRNAKRKTTRKREKAKRRLETSGTDASSSHKALETVALPGAEIARSAVDDVAEFIGQMPQPLRMLLRCLVFVIGTSGFLALAIIRVTLIPILFGIIGAVSGEDGRESLAESRHVVNRAMDEGIGGFRALASARRRRRKALAEPEEP